MRGLVDWQSAHLVPLTSRDKLALERLASAAAAETAVDLQRRMVELKGLIEAHDRGEIPVGPVLAALREKVSDL